MFKIFTGLWRILKSGGYHSKKRPFDAPSGKLPVQSRGWWGKGSAWLAPKPIFARLQIFRDMWGHQPLIHIILAMATLLRLYKLDASSLWLDEIGQVAVASQPAAHLLPGIASHQGAAPLDYLATRVVLFFSQSDFALRLPAVLWGILSVFLIYRLGKDLTNERVGLLAAFLLAISPFHVRYSRELRFYSLFVFLAVLTTYLLWKAVCNQTLKSWAFYTLIATLGLYSHYYTAILFAIHGLAVLLVAIEGIGPEAVLKGLLPWLAAAGSSLLLFLPWIIYDLTSYGVTSKAFNIPIPTLTQVLQQVFLMPTHAVSFPRDLLSVVLFGGFFGIGIGVALKSGKKMMIALGTTIIVGPLSIITIDLATAYFFHPRQLLFILPFIILLVAYGISSTSGILRTRLLQRILLVGILIPVTLTSGLSFKEYYEWEKEPWKTVAHSILINSCPQDVVVVPRVAEYLLFYAPDLKLQTIRADSFDQLTQAVTSHERAWVLMTNYATSLPAAFEMRTWLSLQPHIKLRFSDDFEVYYLHRGVKQVTLMREITLFRLPPTVLARSDFVLKLPSAGLTREGLALIDNSIRTYTQRLTSKDQQQLLVRQGRLYYELGDIEQAIRILEMAQAIEPEDEGMLTNLALAYIRAGKLQEAIIILHQSAQLHPASFWSQALLGRAYFLSGDMDAAVQAYLRALEIDPLQYEQMLLLGQAQCHAGQTQKAAETWQHVIAKATSTSQVERATQWLVQLEENGKCP